MGKMCNLQDTFRQRIPLPFHFPVVARLRPEGRFHKMCLVPNFRSKYWEISCRYSYSYMKLTTIGELYSPKNAPKTLNLQFEHTLRACDQIVATASERFSIVENRRCAHTYPNLQPSWPSCGVSRRIGAKGNASPKTCQSCYAYCLVETFGFLICYANND